MCYWEYKEENMLECVNAFITHVITIVYVSKEIEDVLF